MSFNPSIPQITDPMSQSQGQIKANWQAINNAFSKNHAAFNKPTQGQHNLLNFREQSTDPVTASDQICLYTKAISTNPCLFFMPNSTQTPIQLTYPSIQTGKNTASPSAYFASQYSFVAGPFVIYGGYLPLCVQGQSVTVSPATTILYVGAVAGFNSNNPSGTRYNVCATNIVGSSFNIQFDSGALPLNIYYMAIGK